MPASKLEISTEIISLSLIEVGTFPLTISWAKPSTIAVLPTPASPTSIGLFLVRRHNTSAVFEFQYRDLSRDQVNHHVLLVLNCVQFGISNLCHQYVVDYFEHFEIHLHFVLQNVDLAVLIDLILQAKLYH